MRFNVILLCLLPAWFIAPTFASSVTINLTDNAATKVGAAKSGDVVTFAAGTFNVTAPITVPSGVTVQGSGASPSATHLVFTLAGGDSSSYGFVIAPNASNVTIQDFDIVSNHGIVQMSNGLAYTNININNNNLEYGGGQLSDGTLVFGISGSILNTGLQIVHNYFHDSPGTARNWSIWFPTNANFDYNTFFNVNDGGQIDNPGPNVSFSYNYGTSLHRMGQEVALVATSTFKCTGNVFYNYVSPYYDTEGVSIIGVSSTVIISNNFFEANMAPGSSWGVPDGGGTYRFGYAIEATGQPCTVSGNTLIGSWADFVSSDIANALVEGNSVYGTTLWGDFDGEPGPYGYGSIVFSAASPNIIDRNTADAPNPPSNTFAGPGTTGSSTGTGSTGSSSSGSTSSASGSSRTDRKTSQQFHAPSSRGIGS